MTFFHFFLITWVLFQANPENLLNCILVKNALAPITRCLFIHLVTKPNEPLLQFQRINAQRIR